MQKITCTKSDYCPCGDCNGEFVKEVDKVICGHKLMKIKNSVEWQVKQRVEVLQEQAKRDFYSLIDGGKTIGEAIRELNLGLMVAGELLMQATSSIRRYQNPYKTVPMEEL